jgi:hypothetical protein
MKQRFSGACSCNTVDELQLFLLPLGLTVEEGGVGGRVKKKEKRREGG